MVRIVRATQVEIESAVQALRDGELVAFATETVYGLGANAQNPAAVAKIFEAKGRPPNHPVIVHLDSPRFLHRWVREVPEAAMRLAERFWPGPFTMVMPRAANVHDVITGGQDTIAIRVPAHPMAQQLLTAFGGGIAAPSANRYGRLSPARKLRPRSLRQPAHARQGRVPAHSRAGGARRGALGCHPRSPGACGDERRRERRRERCHGGAALEPLGAPPAIHRSVPARGSAPPRRGVRLAAGDPRLRAGARAVPQAPQGAAGRRSALRAEADAAS